MNAVKTAWMVCACALALSAACGGDDEGDDGSAGSGGTAAPAGGASGGGAGTSGGGGTASAAGTGGSSAGGTGGAGGMAEPVVCDGTTCPTPMSTRLRACCVTSTNECGERIGGGFFGMCAAPVEPHPDCESAMTMGFRIPSCCTAEGRCGVTAPMIGLACTSNEEIMMIQAGDGGTPDGGMPNNPNAITPPPVGACTP